METGTDLILEGNGILGFFKRLYMSMVKMGLTLSVGLVATIAIQNAGAQAAGENLIKNPGFESNQDWWGFDHSFGTSTGTLVFTDPNAVHGGAKGAKLEVTAVDGENWHIQLQCPPQFEAVKDADYLLTFWGRTNSPDGKSVHVAVQNGAPDYTYRSGQDYRLDTTWQKFERTWLSDTSGFEMLRFNVYVGGDTGTYYFDDFSLTATPAATKLRASKRATGLPLKGAGTLEGIDAAGRSVKTGKTGRAGVAFSP